MWNTRDNFCAAGANWLGCHVNIPRSRPPCNSLLCHDLGHRATLGSEPSRRSKTTENSEAEYADAGCRAAAGWMEPAAQENRNTPKETTKGPRPGPDHLPEEPAFVTFQKGCNVFWVRGLSPTFSRRSTVSQRLVACGSVASGALRSFLSATCGTPCEKTKPTEVINR